MLILLENYMKTVFLGKVIWYAIGLRKHVL